MAETDQQPNTMPLTGHTENQCKYVSFQQEWGVGSE